MLTTQPKFKPSQRVRFQTYNFSGSGVISQVTVLTSREPVYYIIAENQPSCTFEVSESQIFGLDKGLLLG